MSEEFITESQIQAEFYHQAKLIGLNCTCGYQTPVGRLDIAIFAYDWTRLLAAVEVGLKPINLQSKHIERYKRLGVEVFGLSDFLKALELAQQIKQECSISVGIEVGHLKRISPVKRRGKSKRNSQLLNWSDY